MITSSPVMPLVAISTLATIIFIGLGFLPSPSRATALWSAAFASAMVGSYVWLAHDITDALALRALGSGLVIAPMALIWSGLRAQRAASRPYILLSSAYLILVPLGLMALTLISLDVYATGFRVMFAATAVFAGLTIMELVKLGLQRRDEVYPLLAVCALFVVFAVITVVDGVLVASRIPDNADSLQFIRSINMIGSVVYVVCALISVLLLTTRGITGDQAPQDVFVQTATARLNRAEAANDPWWSLLDIRLDDPDDIRAASSTAAFNAVCERFARDVDSVLPADADRKSVNPTRIIALVPRAQGGVREVLTDLLERVSTTEEQQAVPIRMSASVGWAEVPAVGYRLDDLIVCASDAASVAQSTGGDRWERVRGAS